MDDKEHIYRKRLRIIGWKFIQNESDCIVHNCTTVNLNVCIENLPSKKQKIKVKLAGHAVNTFVSYQKESMQRD